MRYLIIGWIQIVEKPADYSAVGQRIGHLKDRQKFRMEPEGRLPSNRAVELQVGVWVVAGATCWR